MSTVEGKKQEKRRALLDAAYELFLERGTSKTSVEDITSRAKVGKGTFYLYFADKGSVTQALLARVSYQLLDNACAAAEQHAAEKEKGAKGVGGSAPEEVGDEYDELLPAAIEVVVDTGMASVSMLQRRLKLGYSRAARLVDQMEERGIVGPFEGSKPRPLLITKEQWQEMKMGGAPAADPGEPPIPTEGEDEG